jgi:hypothetical protein
MAASGAKRALATVANSQNERLWKGRLWRRAAIRRNNDISQVPTSDIEALFDHLIGHDQDRRRYLEAERLGRLTLTANSNLVGT